ncbi:MAG: FkbM family methyltransferase [Verrucomicrobiota bacterium]
MTSSERNFATTIVDGEEVYCLQKREVPLIAKDVRDYLKSGVELRKGDVVFDVGANIGLFSRAVSRLLESNVRIYAFEPIPQIFAVLEANLDRLSLENVTAMPCGLSSKAEISTFYYYPAVPVYSGKEGVSASERNEIKQWWLEHLDLVKSYEGSSRLHKLLCSMPAWLLSPIAGAMVARSYRPSKVDCQMRTLSEVMREEHLERIDLLKIDAEKSEVDILRGISDEDWPRISQVIVEAHTNELREEATHLLRKYGFDDISEEQSGIFEGSSISNLIARRKGYSR